MKKETTNVFNAGMIKDLNNLVVPNDILIDNVNGAFLTYNGDELSLQTDAGNTKIKVAGSEDEYIKLTDGFYPLGMKEKGGVLYIVSGKEGYDPNTGFKDSDYDEIEIGSYPSPQFNRITSFNGQLLKELNNNTLYESYIINTDVFKTSRFIRFIQFPETEEFKYDIQNIKLDDQNGLYVIKLYLMLENGEIDITNDINDFFKKYKQNNPSDTARHWLLSRNFVYYCPYNYKGHLAVRVELDEPIFEIESYVETYNNDEKVVKLTLNKQNSDSLKITEVNAKFYSGNTLINNVTAANDPNDPTKITYTIPVGSSESTSYEIYPNLSYKGATIEFADFPDEFKNKFALTGTAQNQDTQLSMWLDLADGQCDSGRFYYNTLIVMGESGHVTPEGNPTEKAYGFIKKGTTNTNINVIGEYTILSNGRASINASQGTTNVRVLKDLVNTTMVYDSSRDCSTINVTVELSAPLDIVSGALKNGYIRFSQTSRPNINYQTNDGKSFRLSVSPNESLNIILNSTPYSAYETITELSHNAVYKLGLFIDLKLSEKSNVNSQYIYTFLHNTNNISQSKIINHIHNLNINLLKVEGDGWIINPADYEIASKLQKGTSTELGVLILAVINPAETSLRTLFATRIDKSSVNHITMDSSYINKNDNYIGLGNKSIGYLFIRNELNLSIISMGI